jgi:PadR family transcriptional regulator PadR
MAGPLRTTGPLLDVSVCLLQAHAEGTAVHGWAIMSETKRSGPTVYGILDRLEDRRWIAGYWEDENPEAGKPRRRLYRLTSDGAAALRDLVAERRPGALESLDGRARLPGRGRLAPGGAG